MAIKTCKKIMFWSLLTVIVATNLIFMFYNIKVYNSNKDSKKQYITGESFEQNNNIKSGEKSENEDNSANKKNNVKDTEYKLFFGEWEVSKIIGQHQTLPVDMEIAKNNIRKRITYLQDKISFDGQEERNDPQYSLAVVTVLDPDRSYIEKMPSLKDIGIKGEYFVYVYISTPVKKYQGFLGNEFYVKDDKTLIVFFNDVYYELKRVSYIEDAEYGETHV